MLISLSKFIIVILFGSKFYYSYIIFKILIPGISLFSISNILSTAIAGIGKIEYNLYTSTTICILTIILDLSLIKKFGIVGASLATTITYILHVMVTIYFYIKITNSKIKDILIIKKKDVLIIKDEFINRYITNKITYYKD